MRKLATFGVIAALGLAAAPMANATDLSYNAIEGSFISGDDYSGFGVAAAFELTSEFFALGSIDAIDFDNTNIDGNILSLGAGYSLAINPAFDVIATGALKRAKIDGFGSDTGFGIGVGARGRLLSQLEIHGGLEYVDISDSDTTLMIGARWYFKPALAAGIDLADNDGGSTLRFAVRYDFGNRL